MPQPTFVVIDFTVRPHPKKLAVAKDAKYKRGDFNWESITARITARVKKLLTEGLSEDCKSEVTGLENKRTHSYLSTFVLQNPRLATILAIEDRLRAHYNAKLDGMVLKAKDEGRYINVLVKGFRLSGPNGGEWKPFTEWYKNAQRLGVPR